MPITSSKIYHETRKIESYAVDWRGRLSWFSGRAAQIDDDKWDVWIIADQIPREQFISNDPFKGMIDRHASWINFIKVKSKV